MFRFAKTTNYRRRWQFRLSTLLTAMAICAVVISLCFAVLPRYVDGCKVSNGIVLLHLTPAAQELLFDPPAPMGPMHETKVIVLRSVAYNVVTVLTVTGVIAWCAYRWRYFRFGARREPSDRPSATAPRLDQERPSTSRFHAIVVGGLAGAVLGSFGFSIMMKTISSVPQTLTVGCVVGMVIGTALPRRSMELICLASVLLTIIISLLGTIVLNAA